MSVQYKDVAELLQLLRKKDCKTSLKSLVYKSNCKNKAQLMAVACGTLKHYEAIEQLIHSVKLDKEPQLRGKRELTIVLVYELLFGKKTLKPTLESKIVRKFKSQLKKECERLEPQAKEDATGIDDGLFSRKSEMVNVMDRLSLHVIIERSDAIPSRPRYVVVNTLKTTVEEVLNKFVEDDVFKVIEPKRKYKKLVERLVNQCSLYGGSYLSAFRYCKQLASLEKDSLLKDLQVCNLLVFAHGTSFYANSLYLNGDILLIDKASCLPVIALDPPVDSHVIDACAAPGNKTTMLAMAMRNRGQIFAFDRDLRRVSTMSAQLLKARVTCCDIKHTDFLLVPPDEPKYNAVQYVLVDPSCSGSGIVNRKEYRGSGEQNEKKSRLSKLHCIQVKLLSHALSFPSVRRVVYSTCSVHTEENEDVVSEVLEKLDGKFVLRNIFPELRGRGSGLMECVRLSPQMDMTNGFFIACFEKNE